MIWPTWLAAGRGRIPTGNGFMSSESARTAPRTSSPRPAGAGQPSSTSRGSRPVRSNNERSSGGNDRGRANRPPQQSSAPKGDAFASFDTGVEPNLDASFAELGVPTPLLAELVKQGIDRPFPIQAATMVDCLAGRDVLGRGRTGSGKTLAFLLPLLTRLAKSDKPRRSGQPRALILVPTRELAVQIHTAITPYARALALKSTTVFGGVGAVPQINALRSGVDIVIACPGRLIDHLDSGHVTLDAIEITVLDEADHMADMGFLPGVKKLLDRTPSGGQRMLFSATLDNGIDVLVRKYLSNPVLRSVDPAEAVDVKMTHHVLAVTADDRFTVLRDLAAAPGRIMVFTRTKHGAKKLTKTLIASGVPAVEMHGNLSQNARTRNLEEFRDGTATAMIATDVAARGIHIDDVALVVHFDPPVDHKAYLHRSGRTARAGAEGTVVTLMTRDQVSEVRDLTKKAGIAPTVTNVDVAHPLLSEIAPGTRIYVTPRPPAPEVARPAARPGGSRSGPPRRHSQARTSIPGASPSAGPPARNRTQQSSRGSRPAR
jgi:superfamily II DNA/RNA helicase